MSPGAVVQVVSGPWSGRVGVVECSTSEGIAVWFRPLAGAPREVAVVQAGDVRVVELRDRSVA